MQMAIGDKPQAREIIPQKRGCLFKCVVVSIGLVLAGLVSQEINRETPKQSALAPIPPFAFDPLTAQQKSVALQRMRKEVDKVEGDTFYYDRSSPQALSSTAFFPYIGQNSHGAWLRMVVRYSASDWLFFDKIIINADGIKLDLTPSKTDRHVGDGYVSEWIDVPVGSREISILDIVKDSKDVTLRFDGPQFRFDKKITAKEKQVIADVFAAYQALGGKAPQ